MAIGISLALIGLECLILDRAVLADPNTPTFSSGYQTSGFSDYYSSSGAPRVIEPPEWAPWSFLAGGAVVLLYASFLKTSGG